MVPVGRRFRLHLVIVSLWLSLRTCPLHGDDRDVHCLKSMRDSVQDPYGCLNNTWRFENKTQGSICSFTGVECWHRDENKVLNIKLVNMGLKGSFPLGLSNRTSMTGLDLSSNDFSGPLPPNILHIIGFLTSLVFSTNNFSGQIPADLAECTYLNEVYLDHNQFSGQIPANFSSLSQLKKFSMANNLLSGQTPRLQTNFTADAFANNLDLCRTPLLGCRSSSKSLKLNTNIIARAAAGLVTLAGLVIGAAPGFLYGRALMKRKQPEDPEANRWVKSLKGSKGVKVYMFENLVSKMKLGDLMKATNNFSSNNTIGSGRTGTICTKQFSRTGRYSCARGCRILSITRKNSRPRWPLLEASSTRTWCLS